MEGKIRINLKWLLFQYSIFLATSACLLGKQKVLELLKAVYSKRVAVDALLSIVKGEVRTEEGELNKEALSFILRLIREKFPEVEIPPKFKVYIPTIQAGKKIGEVKSKVAERGQER